MRRRDTVRRVRQFLQQRERKLASPERGGGRRSRSEGSYCKVEVLEPLRHFVTPPLSGEACLFKRFVGTRRAVSDVFAAKKKSLQTFHRNVCKITAQQPAHRAERSCSLRPRKAVAFLTHLLRAPKAWRRGFRRLRTATQRAARPLRTPRQLRSVGSALWGNSSETFSLLHDTFRNLPLFSLAIYAFHIILKANSAFPFVHSYKLLPNLLTN